MYALHRVSDAGRLAQRGFTYVALLFVVAIAGIVLGAKGLEWHAAAQREKEAELLFIGEEFRRAIALYYYRTPGPVHEYPQSLEQLIEDARFPGVQRYLRRIYRDPMTGKNEWGLVLTLNGRIMGIHSLSRGKPIKTGNFAQANKDFADKVSYSDWQFVFIPVAVPAATPPRK